MFRSVSRLGFPFCVLLFATGCFGAQLSRIAGRIDQSEVRALAGQVHPWARAEFDRGAADAGLRLNSLSLFLSKTPEQQSALDQLLKEQQDPTSANFHKWLTPEEFADRFGASPEDMAALKGWLESEGFTVWDVANSRTSIHFSGTAAQVAKTFGTEIRNYEVRGEKHYANATEPSVPAAVAGIVSTIHGLHNFYPKPWAVRRQKPATSPFYDWGAGYYAIAPGDVATIYDTSPLLGLGYTGTGQGVALAEASDISASDVAYYRSTFGLPAGNFVVEVYGSDPGTVEGWFDEGNLDADVVSAVAPGATIYYVVSADPMDSVTAAVNNNYAKSVSMSFGGCEPADGSAYSTIQSTAQQANTQGITMVAASGDSGPADCDSDTSPQATLGLAVSLPASVPEVTGVGGTQFSATGPAYWSSQNSATGGSALSYIPEAAWNDGRILASGGGVSIDFSKPTWQTGPGVPNDGARDVPDVSFEASPEKVGWAIAENGALSEGWGGTSAATPLFAAMAAMLNQYEIGTGVTTTAGQGNMNPRLYALAKSTTNVFHDITQGSNIVACKAGTPNCGSNNTLGYSAGPGYDLVTGLGSIDIYNLFLNWSTTTVSGPAISSLSPNTAVVGGAGFTLTVNGAGFVSGATVNWGSTPLPTTFYTAAKLTATVTSAQIGSVGGVNVTVANPGGATSGISVFTVSAVVVPAISSLSPNAVAAGSPQFTLTVNGSNFVSGATVEWGSTPLATTFSSSAKLTATVPSNLVTSTGPVSVTVVNPGGATSTASTFRVSSLTISSLSPTTTAAGSAQFTLTVNGTNFVSGATVEWGSTPLTTAFLSSSKLTATVPVNVLTSAGPVSVTVMNPGGATAPATTFTVAAPGISSLSPNTAGAGSAQFTLTVNGSNFVSGSTVEWGSTPLTTTFSSSSKLTATVLAGLVTGAGPVSVTVVNPGGATSGASTFTVLPLSISTISPTAAGAGSAQFTLTVNGTNFVSGATVEWGTTALATTFSSSSVLTATVPASVVTTPGPVSVTVVNPGGAATAALTFTVGAPTISSLSPTSAGEGIPFTLTVSGSNFVSGSKIQVGASVLTTTFNNSGSVKANVPGSAIPSAGPVSVTVVNSPYATSNSATLNVGVPTPTITSLSPRTATHGGATFTLFVSGTNFGSGAVVKWNGTPLATVVTSQLYVKGTVTANLIASKGTAQITVVNPGGQPSAASTFTIQ